MNRRELIAAATVAGLAATLPRMALAATSDGLTSLTTRVVPISVNERRERIVKLQRLMRGEKLSAILIEPGASLTYFTGIRWHRSERLTAAVIPAEGDIGIVTPYFEESSVRETLAVPADVRTWNEDQDPLAIVAGFLRDRKAERAVGVEETMRYFAVDALGKVLPRTVIKSAAGPVRGCRMVKSPAEIALMQAASDVTIAAYRYTGTKIAVGMTPPDIAAIMNRATRALGGDPEFELILLGEASAYPHGSGKPQVVKQGDIILMDCGCSVQGYQSDISRTLVMGQANAQQRKVWDQVRRGQQVAFAAARTGVRAGAVDDAVRKLYESFGYGPGYKLPGLSHRTGHGIGLDGHEPVNLVRGENAKLEIGMCFSNEPGIYIPGSFGVRLEDCFYMTKSGPKWFSVPPQSIDQPFEASSFKTG